MASALFSAITQGILWGVMILGVYITYKLLDIADLSVDGTFALGGCVAATAVMTSGMDPWLALLIAFVAGCLAGGVTGLMHALLNIPAILAGILTMIGLWSVNLRIMGKSNIPLLNTRTIYTDVTDWTGLPRDVSVLIVGVAMAAIVVGALYWFFGTEIGSAIRATGNNHDMVRALGVDTRVTILIAVMLSNGLVALSGALVCQSQKYADVGMGTGAIVIGLASIVIGEALRHVTPGKPSAFGSRLVYAVIGSAAYFLIRAIVLQLGLDANDMKLFTAVIVAVALGVPYLTGRWRQKHSYQREGATIDG
ncbi:ABC transporter permease [Olsenella sp. YH-ols2217]|uniref:ABC transporter permease n=1 Tax=Kribbibacterium absianum TaxID=3044210 RepID=A0ABT6ZMF2_9ACTN|nr:MULTISPECIES: ABC transporter permease [unclassified Olsenella]MDJ1122223.1 ABC transporter permease [Olsenella sp. YH-ols2216]MDJ1130231.1 ABC transporter permease [Olsenella sp. YH-ols2217]